jgi:hypothetical protein
LTVTLGYGLTFLDSRTGSSRIVNEKCCNSAVTGFPGWRGQLADSAHLTIGHGERECSVWRNSLNKISQNQSRAVKCP